MPKNITQFILGPVAVRRQRRRLHWRLALVWLVAAGLGGVLWLVGRQFDAGVPQAVWLLPGMALLAALAVAVIVLRKAPDVRAIAREIEARSPELNALIQSAVEQEPDPRTGELNFLQQRVIDRAAQVLQRQPWVRQSASALSLSRAANQTAALLLLGTVLALHRQDVPPLAFAASERVVREIEVLPGDGEIEKGSALIVMARFPGRGPDEASLELLPARGEARRLAMNRNLDDPTFAAQVGNVTEDLLYRVEFSGGRTRDFKLTVFEYPRLLRGDAVLTYPGYTGLPSRTIEDTRRINGVEGTDLEYRMTLNKPVVSARLWSTNGTELPLVVDSASSNVLKLAVTLRTSSSYFLSLVDEAGRSNRYPEEISMVVVPNREPQLRLVSPRGDQRFSPLEEVSFRTEISDDFGLLRHGFGYSINGGESVLVELGGASERFEKQQAEHLLALEAAGVATDDLVSYYLWAEDFGPDGRPRRVEGDIFFGDIRQLDEIYRQGDSGDQSSGDPSQQQQQQQNGPASELLELQKEIISATWNVKRAENASEPSAGYRENVGVIHESQEEALVQAEAAGEQIRDARMRVHLQDAIKAMNTARDQLAMAAEKNTLGPLPPALSAEQAAYQQLLRLQAREFEVSRQQRGQSQGRQGRQRNQQQLDELDLEMEEQAYQNERQAQSPQTAEQREDTQVLSRLKDLARRQNDLNERLKELQTALLAAEDEQEKDELRRELKRLQEQQQQLLSDLDELNQRMSSEQNQSRMSEARQQLEETRESMRSAAQQLGQEQASSALASGTRAQQELQEMSDEFRQRAAGQFTEQMRELRNTARELESGEQDLARKFAEAENPTQKSLADSPARQELREALTQQQERLTNVLSGVRRIAEEAEFVEPLLARQLYDTFRDLQRGQTTRDALPRELQRAYDQLRDAETGDLENTFRLAAELVDRGLAPWARQVEELGRPRVEQLARDVDRAADSILGDDLQALRSAERELEQLATQLSRELAVNSASGSQDGTNRVGSATRPGAAPEDPPAGANEEGLPTEARQVARADTSAEGNPESNQQGNQQQPGARRGSQGEQAGQQSDGQSDQPGSPSPGEAPGGQRGGGGSGQSEQPGEGQGGQGREPSALEQAARQQAAEREGRGGRTALNRGGTGSGGGPEDWAAVFSGDEFVNWSDRLRDVEEMLDDPRLRLDAATIRARARDVRIESRRHSKPPQWDLVQMEVMEPLQQLRERVREEIVRRQSPDSLVAIDSDPVPGRYAELVRRYYEQLGGDSPAR